MARKFKFKLQPVLRYRERIEDETRKRFLEIQRIRDEKLTDLEKVRRQTLDALNAMQDAESGRVDVPRVKLLNRYLTGLHQTELKRKGELRAIEGEVEKRREEFVSARQGVKVMEKFRERQTKHHAYEEGRAETKDLDEMGAVATQRKKSAARLYERAARSKNTSHTG